MFEMQMGETNSIKKAHLIAYKQHLIDMLILKAITKNQRAIYKKIDETFNRLENSKIHPGNPRPNEYLEIVK